MVGVHGGRAAEKGSETKGGELERRREVEVDDEALARAIQEEEDAAMALAIAHGNASFAEDAFCTVACPGGVEKGGRGLLDIDEELDAAKRNGFIFEEWRCVVRYGKLPPMRTSPLRPWLDDERVRANGSIAPPSEAPAEWESQSETCNGSRSDVSHTSCDDCCSSSFTSFSGSSCSFSVGCAHLLETTLSTPPVTLAVMSEKHRPPQKTRRI